jgi:hypothetical protein
MRRWTSLTRCAARRRFAWLLGVAAAGVFLLNAASAQAVTFGADLSSLTPDSAYTCGFLGGVDGCTVEDPLMDDMELVLPDPVSNGDQTGVVTSIQVKAAVTEPAQFVVVEWSGKPGQGNPFPSGVMALSAPVTLQPGINNFNTNLPVDRRLASNGYESWSVVSLNILGGSSPLPVAAGGTYAETGVLLNNDNPLTTTSSDLTLPPNSVEVGGIPPGRLLMSGDVTITTGQTSGTTTTGTTTTTGGGTSGGGTTSLPQLTLATVAKAKGRAASLALTCGGNTSCSGTVRLQGGTQGAAGKKAKAKPITYATGTFAIPAGSSRVVLLTLTRYGKQALKSHRSISASAIATVSGRLSSTKITLKR